MNDRSPEHRESGTRGQGRLIAGAILGGLAVLFAVLNLDPVRVHWIFVTSYTPLIVVILVCLAIGWTLGWLATRYHRARR